MNHQILRTAIVALCCGPALILSTAFGPDAGETLRTQRLEIVDTEGKLRIAVGVDAQGDAAFDLYDAKQQLRGRLASFADGSAGLYLFDALQTTRGVWATRAGGVAGMAQFDASGVVRSTWDMNEKGEPALSMYDGRGTLRLAMQTNNKLQALVAYDQQGDVSALIGNSSLGTSRGGPAMVLYDTLNQKIRLSLNLDENQHPMLALHDAKGVMRGAWMETGGGIGLSLFGSDARPRLLLGVDPAGKPGLRGFDHLGHTLFSEGDDLDASMLPASSTAPARESSRLKSRRRTRGRD